MRELLSGGGVHLGGGKASKYIYCPKNPRSSPTGDFKGPQMVMLLR